MSVEKIRSQLKSFAKDIKINLGRILEEENAPGLALQQIRLIALSSTYATQNSNLTHEIEEEFSSHLSEQEFEAAKAAASIMAMNNIYYRFTHLVSDTDYRNMPAGLRMNVITQSGVKKVEFELMSLAVSAINGCAMCMDSHVRTVVKEGITKKGVQSTIRIASVIHATSQALFLS